MATIALESHYWDSQPHRPACITVRDDTGLLHTYVWDHERAENEEEQHFLAVREGLAARGVPVDHAVIYSARWRTGWRHVVVIPPEDTPC